MTTLVSDSDNQEALAKAIRERPELLFKAAEFAHGKPRQSVDQDFRGPIEIRWQDSIVERLHEGRKRVAEARRREQEET